MLLCRYPAQRQLVSVSAIRIAEFPIDNILETAYIDTSNERFTFDDLGNRLKLNNRAGNDVAYAHNTANEYTNSGGQSVWTVG